MCAFAREQHEAHWHMSTLVYPVQYPLLLKGCALSYARLANSCAVYAQVDGAWLTPNGFADVT